MEVEIHSASPISSDSSKAEMNQEKPAVPIRPSLAKMHQTSWTSYMIRDDSEPSSLFSLSGSGSGSSVPEDTTSDAQPAANRKNSTTDTNMEHVPPVTESESANRTTTTHTTEPVTPDPNTIIYRIPSTPTLSQNASPRRKSVNRIHTRNTSISATMELPWKIDTTSSSSYTPTSLTRNPSFGIPPPPKAGEISRNSSNSVYSDSDSDSITDSPKLHPLMKRVATFGPSGPSPYTHSSTHQAPSPYTTTTTTSPSNPNPTQYAPFNFDFPNFNNANPQTQQNHHQQQQKPHTHSLTNPPGYTQNTHASFSTINSTTNSHTTPSTSISLSTNITTPSRRSSTQSDYSPLDTSAPPLYTSNTSPLYQNTTTNQSSYGYNTTLFSPSFSFTAPKTQTTTTTTIPNKKPQRAGILDNDPSIYLTGSNSPGGGQDEDGSIWDVASKWVRGTSSKLSFGGDINGNGSGGGGLGSGMKGGNGEFSVSSGLWRMVGGAGEKRDGY